MSVSSSETTEVEVNVPTTANQDVNSPGESSASGTGVEKSTLLEAVVAATSKGSEASPTSEVGKDKVQPETRASGEAAEGEAEKLSDPTEEEIASYTRQTQRRIKQLLGERDDAKLQTERLQPRAEQYDRLVTFMRDNDIGSQDFNNALEITRLINSGDINKALEVLTPIYRELASKAGEILPADLQERIRLGHIGEQDARELNRARKTAEAVTAQQTRASERSVAAEETRRVEAMISTATKAADDWATAKAKSDPDWSLKQPLVAEQVELELQRAGQKGFPKDAQQAVALAEKALKTVEDRVKILRPKPLERNPVSGQFASPLAKAQPKSLLEACKQAVVG